MKCSDCKYFKTDECKLKPEAEYVVAEQFACFKSASNGESASVKHTASPRVPKDTSEIGFSIAVIVFCIGIIGTIMALGMIPSYKHGYNADELGPLIIDLLIVLPIFSSMALVGGIWWLVEWKRLRRHRNSFGKRDSSSVDSRPEKQ